MRNSSLTKEELVYITELLAKEWAHLQSKESCLPQESQRKQCLPQESRKVPHGRRSPE